MAIENVDKFDKVIISHKWEYPLLECLECERQFVLIAVSGENIIPQAEFAACPFCGVLFVKTERERR